MTNEYYRVAIKKIQENVDDPSFFVFSDNIELTKKLVDDLQISPTFVESICSNDNAYVDLWLMSLCKHFVIANSTFSWWGAWLSANSSKIIVCPKNLIKGITWWGFDGLIPNDWVQV